MNRSAGFFDISLARTKAGYLGQVTYGGTIIWESEAFPDDGRPALNGDGSYDSEAAAEKAVQAARDKVKEVLTGLFQ